MRRTSTEIATDGWRPIGCKRCFRHMTLNRTEARPLGYELRIFECIRCDIEHQVFVMTDPLTTPVRRLGRQQPAGAGLMPRPFKTLPPRICGRGTRAAAMAAEAETMPPFPQRDEAMQSRGS